MKTNTTPRIPTDIFDAEGRRAYQTATWKRTDIPVEVITFENVIGQNGKTYHQRKYANLAEAQKDFPHLTLRQGMRGEWRGECEYVLRFEEYSFN